MNSKDSIQISNLTDKLDLHSSILSKHTQFIESAQSDKNLALVLAIFAILLCVIFIVILIIEAINYRKKTIEVVLNSERIKKYISQYVPNNTNYTARQLSESDIKQIINKSIDEKREKEINAIVDRVMECIQLDKTNSEFKAGKTQINSNQPSTLSTQSNILYATPADKGIFEITSKEITDDSFYRLVISNNQKSADFELINNEKVTTKVFKVNDYLDSACEIYGSGSTKIVTTNRGKADIQSNGKWKVITKAKVKFE